MIDVSNEVVSKALLRDRIEMAIRRARRSDQPLAVVYVHVRANPCAEELLAEFGRRIAASIRDVDSVARGEGYGRFTILLEAVGGPWYAKAVARRAIEALSQPARFRSTIVVPKATASILVVRGSANAEELLGAEDSAVFARLERRIPEYFAFFEPAGESEEVPFRSLESR